MPLSPGSSDAVIGRNIREMQAGGHPHAQAVAAALREAGKAKKYAEGQYDDEPAPPSPTLTPEDASTESGWEGGNPEAGFLSAIHAAHTDPTNALSYADWLRENGKEAHADVVTAHATRPTVRFKGGTRINPATYDEMVDPDDEPWETAVLATRDNDTNTPNHESQTHHIVLSKRIPGTDQALRWSVRGVPTTEAHRLIAKLVHESGGREAMTGGRTVLDANAGTLFRNTNPYTGELARSDDPFPPVPEEPGWSPRAPEQYAARMARAVRRLRRYARRAEEIAPFAEQMTPQALGGRFGAAKTSELRRTHAQSLADFLEEADDPRAALVYNEVNGVTGDAGQPLPEGTKFTYEHADDSDGHAYEMSTSGIPGHVEVGWFPPGMENGFVNSVPESQARRIADTVTHPAAKARLHKYLDTLFPPPPPPGPDDIDHNAPFRSRPVTGDVERHARAVRRVVRYSHEAFAKQIAENPSESTHRAVYADWLEENDPGAASPRTLDFLRTHQGPAGVRKFPSGRVHAWDIPDRAKAEQDLYRDWYQLTGGLHGDLHSGPGGHYAVVETDDHGFNLGESTVLPTYDVAHYTPGTGSFSQTRHSYYHNPAEAHEIADQLANIEPNPSAEREHNVEFQSRARRYAAYRAPAGGMVARGTAYKGGEMVPDMDGPYMNPPAQAASKFHPEKLSAARARWDARKRRVPPPKTVSDFTPEVETGGMPVVSYARAVAKVLRD